MITLAELAALQEEYAEAWQAPVAPVTVTHGAGDVTIGDGPITLMSCVNLSQDSTYRESIAADADAAERLASIQLAQGAQLVDLGAESSNSTSAIVGPQQQADQLVPVVRRLADTAVVSVESYHPDVVAACLEAGARVVNLTGREHEDAIVDLVAEHDATLVMCFGLSKNVRDIADVPPLEDPFPALLDHFGARLERARRRGAHNLVIDPGMGFVYRNLDTWQRRAAFQTKVLAQTFRLRPLGAPVCNVLPHTLDVWGDEFRKAEGFYAVLAALGGTHLLRIHEVPHLRAVLRSMTELSVR